MWYLAAVVYLIVGMFVGGLILRREFADGLVGNSWDVYALAGCLAFFTGLVSPLIGIGILVGWIFSLYAKAVLGFSRTDRRK